MIRASDSPRRLVTLLRSIVAIAILAGSSAAQDLMSNAGARNSSPGGAFNFQTDLFTGTFSQSVPIVVPPGRGHSEPSLSLSYSPSGSNDWCGVGWALDAGFIQRSTKDGVPVAWDAVSMGSVAEPLLHSDDARGFEFSSGGSGSRLVSLGSGEYRAEVDRAFLRFDYDGTAWTVMDKAGTAYVFGDTSGSRMEHPAFFAASVGERTFRWALHSVRDASGNTTTYDYETHDGRLYLATVSYNGNDNSPALAATHVIEFVTEQGRTDVPMSFRSGFRVSTARLLTQINVRIGSSLVRRYALAYDTSELTGRTVLTSVTTFGKDADKDGALPLTPAPLRFEYNSDSSLRGFGELEDWPGVTVPDAAVADEKAWNSPRGVNGELDTMAALMDIDGDGFTDRLVREVDADNLGSTSLFDMYLAHRGTASGFASPTFPWGPLHSPVEAAGTAAKSWGSLNKQGKTWTTMQLIDFDRDGYPDRVMATDPVTDALKVQLNTGLGFAATAYASLPTVILDPSGTKFATEDYRRPGFRFVESPFSRTISMLLDINGDGRPDRVLREPGVDSTKDRWYVQLNVSRVGTLALEGGLRRWGFIEVQAGQSITSGNWTSLYVTESRSNSITRTDVMLLDVNGDGLADRVMRKDSSPFNTFMVQFNNGYGFESIEPWGALDESQGHTTADWACPASSSDGDKRADLVDINGDNLPDRVLRAVETGTETYDTWWVQLNTGSGLTPITAWTNVQTDSTTNHKSWKSLTLVNDEDDTSVDFVDIDGDGLPDRVQRELLSGSTTSYSKFRIQRNRARFADCMLVLRNGVGGSLAIKYAYSTAYDNHENEDATPWPIGEDRGSRSLLASPMITVAAVTQDDGMGWSATTTYDYSGGMHDASSNEFRGFHRVTVTDPNGATDTHWYHQGGGRDASSLGEFEDPGSKAKKGMPFREEARDRRGNLLHSSLSQVKELTLDATAGWYFPYVACSIDMRYEGLSTPRSAAQTFTFDPNTCNLVDTVKWGEVVSVNPATYAFTDTGSDAVYIHTDYGVYGGGTILDRPIEMDTAADASFTTMLRETLTDYDPTTGKVVQRSNVNLSNGGALVTESFDYDSYGNLVTATDPRGYVTTTDYETTYHTFPSSVTRISGSTPFQVKIVQDPASGLILSSTDPSGLRSEIDYDQFYRVIETRQVTAGGVPHWLTRFTYDFQGISAGSSFNRVTISAPSPNDMASGYLSDIYSDGLGRKLQIRRQSETAGMRRVETFGYDAVGHPASESLPYFESGAAYAPLPPGTPVVQSKYDDADRVILVTPPVGEKGSPTAPTTTVYHVGTDPLAQQTTDPTGTAVRVYYDANGRLVRVEDGTGTSPPTTLITRDRLGQVIETVNATGDHVVTEYDSLGRQKLINDPAIGEWTLSYDDAGNMIQQTDAKGQRIVNEFDELGRLVRSEAWASGGLTPESTTDYEWDAGASGFNVALGQLFRVTDDQGWEERSYDDRGRLVKEARHINANSTTYTMLHDYDEANRPVQVTYPGGSTVITEYDIAGHVSRVKSGVGVPGSPEIFFDAPVYDEQEALRSLTYGNGVVTSIDYYDTTHLSKRIHAAISGSAALMDLSYTYNEIGDALSITDGVYSSGPWSGTMSSITYDSMHRLTGYTRGSTYTFRYDNVGRFVHNSEFGPGDYTYDPTQTFAVTAANGNTYTYDANGNTTQRTDSAGTQTLSWDARNRLTTISAPSLTASFGYAYDGRRLWRSQNGISDYFPFRSYEVKNGNVLCHVYAGGRFVASYDPLSSHGGQGRGLVYHNGDQINSSRVLSNASGALAQRLEYLAHGKRVYVQIGTGFLPTAQFAGQALDDTTGLMMMGARYYDPLLGRFIQPDALQGSFEDSQLYDRYGYARNNPLGLSDPSGRFISALTVTLAKGFLGGIKSAQDGGSFAVGFVKGFTIGSITAGLEIGFTNAGVKQESVARSLASATTEAIQGSERVSAFLKRSTIGLLGQALKEVSSGEPAKESSTQDKPDQGKAAELVTADAAKDHTTAVALQNGMDADAANSNFIGASHEGESTTGVVPTGDSQESGVREELTSNGFGPSVDIAADAIAVARLAQGYLSSSGVAPQTQAGMGVNHVQIGHSVGSYELNLLQQSSIVPGNFLVLGSPYFLLFTFAGGGSTYIATSSDVVTLWDFGASAFGSTTAPASSKTMAEN